LYHTPKKGSKIFTCQFMKIFQLEISRYTYSDFLKEITTFLHEEDLSTPWRAIFTPNPEICLKTLEDTEFLELLQKANYLTSDGIWLYLAYQIQDTSKLWAVVYFPYFLFNVVFRKKYLYTKYGERICWSDLTTSLIEYSQHQEMRVAIIDPSYPQDKQKCLSQESFREKLSQKFPRLIFDFYIYSEDNSDEIFSKISKSWAKILFSTLGMKKQELSVIKWLQKCKNLRLWLGIWSSFDYHIWFQKRAPKLFRDLGFEWLYRIFTSPNKLQRLSRIYQALIIFPLQVIRHKNNEKNI